LKRTTLHSLVTGAVLAVIGAVLVDAGAHVGNQLVHLGEMGLAVGAVLGLVPHRPAGWRAAAFAVGFADAWLGYALRAGALPDIPMGRALATFIVLIVLTAVVTISGARLPLWAGLLGIAAFAGGYEAQFTASPTTFLTDSLTAATTIAFAVAVGFLVTEITTAVVGRERAAEGAEAAPPTEAPEHVRPLTSTTSSEGALAR